MAIRSIRSAALRQLWEDDDASGLPPKDIRRLRTILLGLHAAAERRDLQRLRGIHRLRGDLDGYWSARVDRHRRVVFRYEDGDAYDIDYPGYH